MPRPLSEIVAKAKAAAKNGDWEAVSGCEREICGRVLRQIARGTEFAKELATEAVKVLDIKGPRC